MSQDMVWHEVYEALGHEECPVCKLVKKAVNSYIDGFLYENVNDPMFQERLRKEKGFCNAHSWLMHSFGEPLAHAILYDAFLRDALAEFNSALPANAKRKLRFRSNLGSQSKENQAECKLCKLESDYEKSYLRVIDENVSSQIDFKNKFVEQGILCVPHMKQYISLSRNSESLNLVQEIVYAKYQGLLHCLAEIRRKNDYRFTGEAWTDAERNAWTKAVEIMVGRKMYEK